MLSYIRRAQRRRMYERANSDSGCTNEPESPSSPTVSSSENGQKSEGFHFYSTVKKQHSMPEVGAKNSSPNKQRLNEKREEKLNDTKTKTTVSGTTAQGSV